MDQDSDMADQAEFNYTINLAKTNLPRKKTELPMNICIPAPFLSRKSQDERFNHGWSAVHSSGDFLTFNPD